MPATKEYIQEIIDRDSSNNNQLKVTDAPLINYVLINLLTDFIINVNQDKWGFDLGLGAFLCTVYKDRWNLYSGFDCTWDFSKQRLRLNPGVKFGHKKIGLEVSYLHEAKENRDNRGIRTGVYYKPVFPMFTYNIYCRYGHILNRQKNNYVSFGIEFQQWFPDAPFW